MDYSILKPSERIGRALLTVRDRFTVVLIDAFKHEFAEDYNTQIIEYSINNNRQTQ